MDHAANVQAAPAALKDLTHRVVPLVLAIEQEIVKGTNALPASGHPNYFPEKRRVESELVRTIHPTVMEVEDIADQFASNTKRFIDRYRTLVAELPFGDSDGLQHLQELPSAFDGDFASVFAMGSNALRDRLLFIRKLTVISKT